MGVLGYNDFERIVLKAWSLDLFPFPGSEIVKSAELRKREHGKKDRKKKKKNGRKLFSHPQTFLVPFIFASSPLSESLEQAT